jgi:hypothetical protein
MRLPPDSLLLRIRDFFVFPLRVHLDLFERAHRADARERLAERDRYADPRSLVRHGYRCFSQFEEDGILDEIFRRIGATNRFFVEFGVGNGLENNTLALLLAGWSGLWIEADEPSLAHIRGEFREVLEEGRLAARGALVTPENIEALLHEGGVPAEPDLLSVDIDGNDYWVWRAIGRFRPRVVVIEYNATLGRSARLTAPYDAAARWDGTTRFGCSLGALEDLGRDKGYALVGCTLAGVNAFFVREDCLAEHFLPPYTAAQHFEPPRYGPGGAGHPPRWGRFIRP